MKEWILELFETEYAVQVLIAEFSVGLLLLPKRKKFALRTMLSFVACIFASYAIKKLFSLFHPEGLLWDISIGVPYFLIFLLSVGTMAICFRGTIWGILFCASAAQSLQHMAHRIRDLIINCFGLEYSIGVLTVSGLACCAAVYAGFCFLLRKRNGSKSLPNLNNKKMTFAVVVCTFICLFIGVHSQFKSVKVNILLDLVIIMLCVFVLLYQFDFLNESYRQKEIETLNVLVREMQDQYAMKSESIDLINSKCHDIRKMIREFGERFQIGQETIGEITDAVSVYDSSVDTGNKTLDAILTDKSLACESNAICFTCMVEGERLSFIKPMDLYSLFDNILNNAIEASKSLGERAVVKLNVHTEGNLVFIQCENYFDHKLEYRDGLPVTTKDDKSYHGYGLKSVIFVAEKYGGAVNIDTEGDVFTIGIVLPIPS